MLYARTANENALTELFRPSAALREAPPIGGSCLVVLYQGRRDCDLVLNGLAERRIAYLPPEWYSAETVARHLAANQHPSMSAYLAALLSSFPETVAIPVHYTEFFPLARLGVFEPAPANCTFAMLARRRGVDEAAASYLDETGLENVTLADLDEDVFAWLLDRSFTIPQQREILRSYMDARRLNSLEMRMEQCRATPRAFYDRLLKNLSLVDDAERSDGGIDADRRQQEVKVASWLQDRTEQMVQGWMRSGWPAPSPGADAVLTEGKPPEANNDAPAQPVRAGAPQS